LTTADLSAQLPAFRADLLRFARLQLRDEAAAEDAVQETLLAALEPRAQFGGHAQLRTWLFAILKNKVVDIIRRRSKEPSVELLFEEIPEDSFDALFDERGHWRPEDRPADWGNPEQSFEDARFRQVFDACLNRLPENTARVFMMREFLGFETAEICKELAISATNCWVVLHRARMALRLCLDNQWFGVKE
jgi:RNA polymerase sigma-70 factor, ECF subfamily